MYFGTTYVCSEKCIISETDSVAHMEALQIFRVVDI